MSAFERTLNSISYRIVSYLWCDGHDCFLPSCAHRQQQHTCCVTRCKFPHASCSHQCKLSPAAVGTALHTRRKFPFSEQNLQLVFTKRHELQLSCCYPPRTGFKVAQGARAQVSHQQRASHQTVHILFLANDRCLRDYEMQSCMWPSWCHCHSLSLAPVKSTLVLPFW